MIRPKDLAGADKTYINMCDCQLPESFVGRRGPVGNRAATSLCKIYMGELLM